MSIGPNTKPKFERCTGFSSRPEDNELAPRPERDLRTYIVPHEEPRAGPDQSNKDYVALGIACSCGAWRAKAGKHPNFHGREIYGRWYCDDCLKAPLDQATVARAASIQRAQIQGLGAKLDELTALIDARVPKADDARALLMMLLRSKLDGLPVQSIEFWVQCPCGYFCIRRVTPSYANSIAMPDPHGPKCPFIRK